LSIHFDDIAYLQVGNERQRLAYEVLTYNQVLEKLADFTPLLVGTIPIGIDIENSDLDIICYCTDAALFSQVVTKAFGTNQGFESRQTDEDIVIARFVVDGFSIEIWGQAIPVKQQYAYRHMIIEHKLLTEQGETFRQKIIALKQQGHKTEPAFAIALCLSGNPYQALLQYEE